ncbi:hypothetical protein DFJ58DRAFT_741771 [Suillus subalutaceus]|uniref:uncharacterized protein n=1 Tax=Suillus subalutaceus TaxID=48586 RepID=UPI001B88576C|nr:uncharacterized protein DFJ58DRAFT_741771 [Suillus subalutaceus]KAG1872348.1 hypothetical protein DFJ58DRAFT_741771 [Suillus subalutaceus]
MAPSVKNASPAPDILSSTVNSGSCLAITPVVSLNLPNLVQTFIITIASSITRGIVTPAMLWCSSLITRRQLYFPLLNLSGVYRAINQTLVDTEKLLHLDEPTEVVDEPDPKESVVSNGEVESYNVSFIDHQTSALHNISPVAKAEKAKAHSCASSTVSTTSNPAQGVS